jgi:type IV pilus assembly protein PilE
MTLIELLIALVIVSVLAGLAWPSFQGAMHKSRRADAMSALTEIAQAQERWRANNPTYKATLTSPPLPGAHTTSQAGHYNLAITADSATATAYTATATVISASPQSSDTQCQVMRVVVSGGNITYNSGTSSSTTNAAPDPCWVR